jgi:hypothetical protein
MLQANLVGGRVEVDEVAAPDVHGADAEASCSGVNQVEIHQAFEGGLERNKIVVAHSFGAQRRIEEGWRLTRSEESRRAAEEDEV